MTRRVHSGVPGLDDVLHGGFLEGSAVLVEGGPGTGKTTLGMQFLHTGIVKEDEPGLLITFEEFPSSLIQDARSHNWDLRALEEANKLRLVFTSPQTLLSSLRSPFSPLNRMIVEWDIRRIVLDSVSHFARITRNPTELRDIYGTVINGLKREGITSILTRETNTNRLYPSGDKLSFVVDAILMMRYVEIDSAIQRAILVLKMRGSPHAHGVYRYDIQQEGMAVRDRFEGLHGLLTGMPTRTRPRRSASR
ncbi:MAG: ATPase [Anaerolineae bacterium]|nr:ATPase [Anaerolineae bacterium]